ncbi:MAG: DUF952 domain-containing protein [Leptolyngbyaceae cyanobacterium RU_5_1]|nr:DUF952 domain-containing protein [Leptolyngbyaceae cyanobacterium RU_5_1]
MDVILHITSRSHWQHAQQASAYCADSLDSEGFIHCSTPNQVVWVANTFYQGQSGLVLLCIAPSQVQPELRYDEIETGERFPHIYGPLNLDAVIQVLEFEPDTAGRFVLPGAIAFSRVQTFKLISSRS